MLFGVELPILPSNLETVPQPRLFKDPLPAELVLCPWLIICVSYNFDRSSLPSFIQSINLSFLPYNWWKKGNPYSVGLISPYLYIYLYWSFIFCSLDGLQLSTSDYPIIDGIQFKTHGYIAVSSSVAYVLIPTFLSISSIYLIYNIIIIIISSIL